MCSHIRAVYFLSFWLSNLSSVYLLSAFNINNKEIQCSKIKRCNILLNRCKPSTIPINRSWALYAKKKASKFISDDLLSTLESEIEDKSAKVTSATIATVTEGNNSSKDKKLNKLGLSNELLSSLKEVDTLVEEVSDSKKKKKKDKKKNSGVVDNNEEFEELGDIISVTLESSNENVDISMNSETIVESTDNDLTVEQRVRREKPSSRVRFTESSQPGFVMMGLEKIGLMYGNEVIVKDATFMVQTGERVGLVGPNGGGKSTLLKIMNGEIEPTTGDVIKSSPQLRSAFLRQEFVDQLNMTRTLREELLSSFVEEQALLQEITACEEQLARTVDDLQQMEVELNRLQTLRETATAKEVYSLGSKVEKIMDQTGFALEDGNALVSSFSGGWKMRIGLAKILLRDPNILFLDEPTNHLDLDSVMWLESFLKRQNIPMLIVSHDREFLDQVCNKIVDVEEGVTVSYDGNYSKFLEQRKNRLEVWRDKYDKQTRHVQEEEKWLKKARNDPNLAQQVKAKEMALDKYKASEDWIERPPKDKKFRFRFPPAPRCGENVLQLCKLTHGYGQGKYQTLFQDVEAEVSKGERVGFIGPNGSGKSTMMKIIMGLETPRSGYAEFGSSSVVASYFAQNQADHLDMDKTVLETLQENSPPEYTFTELRALLGQFMFKGDDVDKKIGVLSGGEKARVALCKMMLEPTNLLLLDEPTNHLDINSKEVLEDALQQFGGSVLLISHDRYFMSQVANTIFAFGNKSMEKHNCDYHDYMHNEANVEQGGLKDKVVARYVEGDSYRITNAKEVVVEEKSSKSKNFGGSGVTSGNLYKGIKNAKRFVGNL